MMNAQVSHRISLPLREVRLARGLSLRGTARLAHIDPAQLWRVEHGRSNLSAASLLRLARVLELDTLAHELARFVGNKETQHAGSPRANLPLQAAR
jgi:transcriptional regulator with XRE-family HTH domain